VFSIVEALVISAAPSVRRESSDSDGGSAPDSVPCACAKPDPEGVKQAADFLMAEIRALPRLLAIGVTLGLTAFRAYVFVTHFRPFCSLSVETRRRIVHSWAWGRVGLARQLFRALRSIAIMAYFEDLGSVVSPVAKQEAADG